MLMDGLADIFSSVLQMSWIINFQSVNLRLIVSLETKVAS
jgi:hypothetical protein